MRWFERLSRGWSNSSKSSGFEFYWTQGFFQNLTIDEAKATFVDEFGRSPDPDDPWDNVFFLTLDKERVWSGDPECDVCEGNFVYEDAIREWAAVSQGAFQPTDIVETWDSEEGPVHVKFNLGMRSVHLQPDFQDDWMDLKLVFEINDQIAPSGRQFEMCLDGNFVMLICLTAAEKDVLVRERKIPFL